MLPPEEEDVKKKHNISNAAEAETQILWMKVEKGREFRASEMTGMSREKEKGLRRGGRNAEKWRFILTEIFLGFFREKAGPAVD